MLVSRHLGSHPVVDFVVNPAVGLAPGLGIGWGYSWMESDSQIGNLTVNLQKIDRTRRTI